MLRCTERTSGFHSQLSQPKVTAAIRWGFDMATSIVNLDALIQRDDFRIKSGSADYSRRDKIAITDIEPKAFMYLALRKPDFQRETANWSPQKIQGFVKTFLDGDLAL